MTLRIMDDMADYGWCGKLIGLDKEFFTVLAADVSGDEAVDTCAGVVPKGAERAWRITFMWTLSNRMTKFSATETSC